MIVPQLTDDDIAELRRQFADFHKGVGASYVLAPSTPFFFDDAEELARLRQQIADIKAAWADFQVVLDDDPFNYEDGDGYIFDRLASLIEGDIDITREEWAAQQDEGE